MHTKEQLNTEMCLLVGIKKSIRAERKLFKATGEHNARFNNHGLCRARGCVGSKVFDSLFVGSKVFDSLMESWPKHSGNLNFPVAVGKKRIPSQQYFDTNNVLGITSSTPYTRKRMELLNWMIKDLKRQIEQCHG